MLNTVGKSVLLAGSLQLASASSPMKLESLNVQKGSVTVSGLSSGAFMAVQMHVAYSELIDGVGVFAGGPYYCALGSLTIAEEECMYNLMGGPKVDDLIKYTDQQASLGTIDATSHMADDKVFVFSGSKDTTVYPAVVKTLESYYAPYVSASLITEYTVAAQHCIPTLDYGASCGVKMSPYIGDCDYDGAGAAFQTMYGSSLTVGSEVQGNLHQFDQTEFFTGSSTSINDFGYIYIPNGCKDGSVACRLHLSYHGCAQDYGSIGDTWAVHAGYNNWAEANNIIVVYPYVKADQKLGNGNACWDWWGYTGSNYVLQSGVQMEFSKKIMDRLMGK